MFPLYKERDFLRDSWFVCLIISDYIQLSNMIFKDVNDWLAVQLWHPGSAEG